MLIRDRVVDTSGHLDMLKKELVWIGKNPREARRVSGAAGYENNIRYTVNLMILLERQPPLISWTRHIEILKGASEMNDKPEEAPRITSELTSL